MAYAWSRIRYGGAFDAATNAISGVEFVEVGDEVDAAKLGISDEEFQELVDSGAVREEAPPKDVPANMSATDFVRQQAEAAGKSTETTGGTLMLSPTEQMEVAAAAQADVENAEAMPEEAAATTEEEKLAHAPILAEGGGATASSSSGSSSAQTETAASN